MYSRQTSTVNIDRQCTVDNNQVNVDRQCTVDKNQQFI